MMLRRSPWSSLVAVATILPTLLLGISGQEQPADPISPDDPFRFRTNVELIGVSATVTDTNGRFVAGLTKDDFRVYEDGQPQEILHFSNDRVPVSLGIALDTSGSMEGQKWKSAVNAVNRFLDMLRPGDQVHLYRFGSDPSLVHDWTTDYRSIKRVLDDIEPEGGTALHDAVAQAVRKTQSGRHRRKAVLVISDGHDTSSEVGSTALRQLTRENEVMVYSIAIAGHGQRAPTRWLPPPSGIPFPIPGRRLPPRGPRWDQEQGPPMHWPVTGLQKAWRPDVNVSALREITDETGGRTEVVRSAQDLKPATASIAIELSQQYYLGYSGTGTKDGRWHSIQVEARDRGLRVRARRGYTATP